MTFAHTYRWAWPILSTGIVFAATWAAGPVLNGPSPYVLFLVSVGLSTWIGGLAPGILGAFLATAAGAYFVLMPGGSVGHTELQAGVEILAFALVALLESTLLAALRRSSLRVEEALLLSQQAVHDREEIIAIASHELRGPLTALSLSIHLLGRAAGPNTSARTLRQVEVAQREVVRLTRMLDLMLDLARIRAGRFVLEPEDVDLAALAREVAARFEVQALSDGTTLIVDAPTPVVGAWDRIRLDEVATNLVSNAVKYGCGGRIEISVSASAAEARLAVRDQGIGIAPSDRARIFDRFERVGASEAPGVGLGLYITSEIVRAHGGRIDVDGAPGVGTTFKVSLPRGIVRLRDAAALCAEAQVAGFTHLREATHQVRRADGQERGDEGRSAHDADPPPLDARQEHRVTPARRSLA